MAPRKTAVALFTFLIGGLAAAGAATLGLPDDVAAPAAAGEMRDAVRAIRALGLPRAEAQAMAAVAWLRAGREDQAKKVIEKAAAAGADPELIRLVRGRLDLAAGRARDALGRLGAASGVEALVLRGEARWMAGERRGAEEDWAAAIRAFNALPSPTPRQRLLAARAGRLGKDPYGAVKHLSKLIELRSWSPWARFEMGELFRERYQWGDALMEYEAGLKHAPEDARLLAAMAAVHLEEGRLSRAEKAARQAIEADARRPEPHLVLARVMILKKRYDPARAALAAAAQRRPDDPEVALLRGELAAAFGGDVASARAAYLGAFPADGAFDLALAKASRREGDVKAALGHLDAALAIDERCAPCLRLRGGLLLRQGRLAKARTDLEKARFLDPFQVRSVNYLKILDRFEKFSHLPLDMGVLALSPYGPSAAGDFYRRRLDGMLGELARALDHRLSEPLRVEVFGNQDWMNARAMGLGVEFGAGFSFGRCLTFFSSPSREGRMGWWRAMQHELVHSFNIDRVQPGVTPSWYTEGLATHLEGPRGTRADGVLRGAWFAGQLSSLGELIDWKYGGPKLYLHYLQAGVAMAWLDDRLGGRDDNAFLDDFKAGKHSIPVLEARLGAPFSSLEADYARFLDQTCRGLKSAYVFSLAPDELQRRVVGGDQEAHAKLALVLAISGAPQKVPALIQGLIDPLAAQAEAIAKFEAKAPDAEQALVAALAASPGEVDLARRLGILRRRAGATAGAWKAFQTALGIDPGDRPSVEAMVELAPGLGRSAEVPAILKGRLKADPDDAWAAYQLAMWAGVQGDYPVAEGFYRHAIDVDGYHPELFLGLARIRLAANDRDGAARAYEAWAGVSRLGRGPSAMGSPLEGPVPGKAAGGKAAPPAWLPLVPPPARQRAADELLKAAAKEPDADLAAGAVVAALGRELTEWGPDSEPEVYVTLRAALHGAYGRPAAEEAAISLGRDRRAEAAGFLMAWRRDSPRADEMTEVLEVLAVRHRDELAAWWREHQGGSASDWLRTSLIDRGYPDPPAEADGDAKLWTIALEDDDWYRAAAARHELSRVLGTAAGRGGYGKALARDPAFQEVRDEAASAFRRVLAERKLARER